MKQQELVEIKRRIGYFANLEEKHELLEWLKTDIKDSEDFEREKTRSEAATLGGGHGN